MMLFAPRTGTSLPTGWAHREDNCTTDTLAESMPSLGKKEDALAIINQIPSHRTANAEQYQLLMQLQQG
jgi:hypothetical protein